MIALVTYQTILHLIASYTFVFEFEAGNRASGTKHDVQWRKFPIKAIRISLILHILQIPHRAHLVVSTHFDAI